MTEPRKTKLDHAHAMVRAGLGAIPFAGQASIELFARIVVPPLEKRRDEWMRDVGERLAALEQSGIDLEDLRNNEAFVTVVADATRIAIRNHKEEKLEALRNAIVNTA